MSKLKEGELLEILRDIKLFIKSERTGWWDEKDEQSYQQIKEMIQKPEVAEDWIEEKAREIINKFMPPMDYGRKERFISIAKDFIRKIVEEIK